MRPIMIVCLPGLLVGFGIGAGCTRYLASHCANNEGSQTCIERRSGLFCSMCHADKDGCTDEMPSEDCLVVGGGTGAMSDNTTSWATAGDVMDLGGEISTGEATTLAASDGGDETAEGEMSCNESCSGGTPICDAASDACVPCGEHAQCGDAACNFFTGACLSARVVHVGPGQSYSRLEEAVVSFNVETAVEGTIIVHAGPGVYQDTIVVDGGRTIAFLSFEDDSPVWDNDEDGTSPLVVSGIGATALLDGIVLMGAQSQVPVLRVTSSSRAWVDRSRFGENIGSGVVVDDGAGVMLRNCFIHGNVDGSNALEIIEGRATVLYSTVAAGVSDSVGLSCTHPSSVVVRNSIIVALGDPSIPWGDAVDVNCGGSKVDISYTATESFVPGSGNVTMGQIPYANPDAWFLDYANGDFHLQNEGLEVFGHVAQWQAGDPLTDIDGDSRLALDGAPDYAGADRP